jgi:nucleoside-diphosphate-sugar epimerase
VAEFADNGREQSVRTVLVTGAAGFIGSHSLGPLLDRSFDVHAVASGLAPNGPAGVTWHTADLLDEKAVRTLLDEVRPTHLLHAAWATSAAGRVGSGAHVRWATASMNLADAFSQAGGRRIVAAGSSFEYDIQSGFCSEERTPIAPVTVYGRAKAGLHSLLRAYQETTDALSVAWARIFFTYGPREHPERLVSSVARALLRGEPAPCSHGAQIRDYMDVRDVGSALAALVDSDVDGPVNVASGAPVTLREIIFGIARRTGREDLVRLGEIPSPPDEPPLLVADVRRLNALGWRPRFDLDQGLDDTVAWWAEQLAAGQPAATGHGVAR